MQDNQWEIDADYIAELVEEGDFDEVFRVFDGSAPWLLHHKRREMLERIDRGVKNREHHKRFIAAMAVRSVQKP